MRKSGKQVGKRTRSVAAVTAGLVMAALAGEVTSLGILGFALGNALYSMATVAGLVGVALFAIAAALRVRKFAEFRWLSALYLFTLGLNILLVPWVAPVNGSWWSARWALTAGGVFLLLISWSLERLSRSRVRPRRDQTPNVNAN